MHEEQPWLFQKHVIVQRGHLDVIGGQGLDDRLDLLGDEDKVAGRGQLGVPRGLEVQDGGQAHGRGQLVPLRCDLLVARDRDLIDPARGLSRMAKKLIEAAHVEVRCGRFSLFLWLGKRRLRALESGAYGFRNCNRLSLGFDMEVHGRGFGSEQVVVQRCHADRTLREELHDRADLVLGQHQIAHGHGVITHRSEGNPGPQRQAGFDLGPIDGDPKVSAWEAEPVNPIRLLG